jgi:hypothetical protein
MVISPEPEHPQNANKLRKRIELGKDVAVRDDKVLHKKKPLLQRQVVYHALHAFLSMRDWIKAILRADQHKRVRRHLSQAKPSDGKTNESGAAALALFMQTTNGEIERAEKKIETEKAGVRYHTARLQSILGLPLQSPDDLIPVGMQILHQACLIPEISLASKDQWFAVMLQFLGILIGNELEENDELRKLGDSRGDVEIRTHCKTHPVEREEFKRLKIELRHDAGVNGAIRNRIKEKLSDAFDALVAEQT